MVRQSTLESVLFEDDLILLTAEFVAFALIYLLDGLNRQFSYEVLLISRQDLLVVNPSVVIPFLSLKEYVFVQSLPAL
jgi:hypothetical protein